MTFLLLFFMVIYTLFALFCVLFSDDRLWRQIVIGSFLLFIEAFISLHFLKGLLLGIELSFRTYFSITDKFICLTFSFILERQLQRCF